MALAPTTSDRPVARRRDQQKEQTRLDLALAAFELARSEGLANVRVPQIAEAVGVSPRTFNNYFPSKEAAIVFPTTLRAAAMANNLAERPAGEPLADALIETVVGLYGADGQDGLPEGWIEGFRTLVASESSLRGEHLKAIAAGERDLAHAIADRMGTTPDELQPLVLAAVVVATERAAVLHWFRRGSHTAPLDAVIRTALDMAVRGITDTAS
jgi:AcrR family transcriptional regulator